jgi:hypothetical protein
MNLNKIAHSGYIISFGSLFGMYMNTQIPIYWWIPQILVGLSLLIKKNIMIKDIYNKLYIKFCIYDIASIVVVVITERVVSILFQEHMIYYYITFVLIPIIGAINIKHYNRVIKKQ